VPIISDRLFDEIVAEDRAAITFKNGYTYSGHPVCCAAALKNIEIIEVEGLLDHVREIAPHFQARLSDLARHAIVGDARGMGLVGCVEGRPAPGMSETDRLEIDWEFAPASTPNARRWA
jgi:putrescine---pyruvate transaminase